MADALEHQRQIGQRPQPRQVVPGERVAEELHPLQDRGLHVLLRGLGQQGAEDRVAGVVRQAVAAQLREVRRRQVARPPAGDPGVERDDDRLVAGRLGAAAPGWRPDRGRSACRAGRSRACPRTRRRRPRAGSAVSVDTAIGTPVRAAARAVARSPWPSCAQMPITPTGAMKSGDGSVIPNRSTERSRSVGADEHPRHQSPAVERGAVGALGVLVPGTAGDVGPDPRRHRDLGLGLPAGVIHAAASASRRTGPAGRSRAGSYRRSWRKGASGIPSERLFRFRLGQFALPLPERLLGAAAPPVPGDRGRPLARPRRVPCGCRAAGCA